MGLVLAFQTPSRPAARPQPSRRTEPAQSADILFFTGVRYERRSDAASAASASRPTSAPDGVPPSS